MSNDVEKEQKKTIKRRSTDRRYIQAPPKIILCRKLLTSKILKGNIQLSNKE